MAGLQPARLWSAEHMKTRQRLLIAVWIAGVFLLAFPSVFSSLQAQERAAFWIENNAIVRLNMDTLEREVLLRHEIISRRLALDMQGDGAIYFSAFSSVSAPNIYRLDMGQERVESLVSIGCGLTRAAGLSDFALDTKRGHLYAMASGDCYGKLARANLDGTEKTGDLIDAIP